MTYKKNLILLGAGRVSSADQTDGTVKVVLVSDGRLLSKRLAAGQGQAYGSKIEGFSDDLWLLPFGRLERINEELFYAAE